jgi:ribosomal-protein-alanine N-acetyltransferase
MLETFNFESERLKTTPLIKEDAQVLFQMYSDEEAMQYRGSNAMETLEEAFEMIKRQSSIEGELFKLRLAIRNKLNHDLIGTLLLSRDKKRHHQVEIGFSFGKNHWGKGYGQETLKMVEENLKAANEIREITAWCIKENSASVKIFEKTGYSLVEQSEYPQSHLFLKTI